MPIVRDDFRHGEPPVARAVSGSVRRKDPAIRQGAPGLFAGWRQVEKHPRNKEVPGTVACCNHRLETIPSAAADIDLPTTEREARDLKGPLFLSMVHSGVGCDHFAQSGQSQRVHIEEEQARRTGSRVNERRTS